jgi:FdhD protein
MSNRALDPAAPETGFPPVPVVDCQGLRWSAGILSAVRERLVAEEPLAIEIAYERLGQTVRKVLSVTMRTPGADEDLAVGFLYCEGLLDGTSDIVGAGLHDTNARGERIPTWRVELAHPPRAQELERVSRGIITSAACGLCGRTSLQGLRLEPTNGARAGPPLTGEDILDLPTRLADLQRAYPLTGGCHGAGLFDEAGRPLAVREDVGRHNAVDKVVGAALRAALPTAGRTLVLSGRAGFELVQKAAAAGIALIVAVGAPSSLAVQLAGEAGMTLVGFARGDRFNVYTHRGRLIRD